MKKGLIGAFKGHAIILRKKLRWWKNIGQLITKSKEGQEDKADTTYEKPQIHVLNTAMCNLHKSKNQHNFPKSFFHYLF